MKEWYKGRRKKNRRQKIEVTEMAEIHEGMKNVKEMSINNEKQEERLN